MNILLPEKLSMFSVIFLTLGLPLSPSCIDMYSMQMLPPCTDWVVPIWLWKRVVMCRDSPTSGLSWTAVWTIVRNCPTSDQLYEHTSAWYTRDNLALIMYPAAVWTHYDYTRAKPVPWLLHHNRKEGDRKKQKHIKMKIRTAKTKKCRLTG